MIEPILGNRYVRSRGFIVSEPRETQTHPRSGHLIVGRVLDRRGVTSLLIDFCTHQRLVRKFHGLVDPLCGTSWDKWNWDKLHLGYIACPRTRKGLQRGYMTCPMGQGEVSFDLSQSQICENNKTRWQFRVWGFVCHAAGFRCKNTCKLHSEMFLLLHIRLRIFC